MAVILVAVLGGATATVFATRGSNSGSSAAAAKLRTFVDRTENVLDQAAAGRQEIRAALAAGLNCSISLHQAGQRIASVADNRQSILGQLGNLQTPTPQADEVVTQLQQALQQSFEADRHYRDAFFDAAQSGAGCPPPQNADFRLATSSNARATSAKKRFATVFNPLASRFGRRTWTPADF